ncbi:chorismate mutase [Fastidiosibacter lacustris]|uniref:chorismate mutase n=1 Tax=Fastidiosibacter lacustris TaxID=2056695 RepID=UPI000E343D8F|nr:chorismate mutase [Fastidiosibacter lacustris]
MTAVSTSTTFASDGDISTLHKVFDLIAKRAQIMQSIAADKYVKKSSIYASERELEVLKHVKDVVHQQGLPVYPMLVFTQIQMDMSKFIEQYWLNVWIKTPDYFQQHNLDLELLRNEITKIDDQLYPAIKESLSSFKRCSMTTSITLFSKAMENVKGIPTDPDYTSLMLASLVAVSQVQQ